jgi:two-component system chemotaxis response regulator CheB
MDTIDVLVIDDSVVVRRFLTELISAEPGLACAGAAPNGRIGLTKIGQIRPDLVILDLEMPEMDGLQSLVEIRRRWPRLPVIMYSTLTHRGAKATLDALELGANEYVTKPGQVASPAEARDRVRADLVPKIKALAARGAAASPGNRRVPTQATSKGSSPPVVAAPGESRRAAIELLVIGTSTGGPNALAEVLPQLARDLPVPVAIVQHMPPLFTGMLAERLDSKSAIKVGEAKDGVVLEPGEAWVAPGDRHIVVTRSAGKLALQLNQWPPENSCRPSVDVLFRSAASSCGGGVLAVVLTGMGADGLRGCENVRTVGGTILVQDEATSVVWGMPGFVARAGLADRVLPLSQIASAIQARLRIEHLSGQKG